MTSCSPASASRHKVRSQRRKRTRTRPSAPIRGSSRPTRTCWRSSRRRQWRRGWRRSNKTLRQCSRPGRRSGSETAVSRSVARFSSGRVLRRRSAASRASWLPSRPSLCIYWSRTASRSLLVSVTRTAWWPCGVTSPSPRALCGALWSELSVAAAVATTAWTAVGTTTGAGSCRLWRNLCRRAVILGTVWSSSTPLTRSCSPFRRTPCRSLARALCWCCPRRWRRRMRADAATLAAAEATAAGPGAAMSAAAAAPAAAAATEAATAGTVRRRRCRLLVPRCSRAVRRVSRAGACNFSLCVTGCVLRDTGYRGARTGGRRIGARTCYSLCSSLVPFLSLCFALTPRDSCSVMPLLLSLFCLWPCRVLSLWVGVLSLPSLWVWVFGAIVCWIRRVEGL